MNIIVRLKNPAFWLALVPAVLLAVQALAAPFGYEWDFAVLNQQAAEIINTIFAVLSIIGVTADFTTPGMTDSERAMSYTAPGFNEEEAVG